MSLYQTFKTELYKAQKERNVVRKDALRVLLGEIELVQSRSGAAMPDDKIISLAKKIVSNNDETIRLSPESWRNPMLKAENEVLKEFIPSPLSRAQTKERIDGDLWHSIADASNEGVAIGLAMKFFKINDIPVEPSTVKEVVIEIRSSRTRYANSNA